MTPPPPPLAPEPADDKGRRGGFSPWLVLVLVVALAGSAALGALLVSSSSDDDPSSADPSDSPSATSESTTPGSPSQTPGGPTDVSTTATVTGPPPIPPGLDLNNNRVEYPATNLLDDDPESAYRLPGDASGSVITFELAEDMTISQVGLSNGYTKIDGDVDWYIRNRRITLVTWTFDDGTSVDQPLDPDNRELQLIEVDDIETRSIQLTIQQVSAPGVGPGARDVTAISDVILLGS